MLALYRSHSIVLARNIKLGQSFTLIGHVLIILGILGALGHLVSSLARYLMRLREGEEREREMEMERDRDCESGHNPRLFERRTRVIVKVVVLVDRERYYHHKVKVNVKVVMVPNEF